MIRQRRREMRLEPSSLCAIPSEMAARQADVRACGSVRAGRLRQRRQRRRRRDPPPLSSGRVSLRPSSRAQLQMQTLLNAVSPSAEQPRLDKEGVGVEGSQVECPPGYDEHCCPRDRGTPACDRGSCRPGLEFTAQPGPPSRAMQSSALTGQSKRLRSKLLPPGRLMRAPPLPAWPSARSMTPPVVSASSPPQSAAAHRVRLPLLMYYLCVCSR